METEYASVAYVNSLFAFFCAYWAQQTGRSALTWFFLGLFFGPLTGLALVLKNGKQREAAGSA